MKDLRQQIDQIDRKIIKLLAERMDLVKEIAKFKKTSELRIQDKKREQEVLKNLKEFGKTKKLSPKFIEEVYKKILTESRRIQNE